MSYYRLFKNLCITRLIQDDKVVFLPFNLSLNWASRSLSIRTTTRCVLFIGRNMAILIPLVNKQFVSLQVQNVVTMKIITSEF